jgi:hypothetical protein
MDIFKELPHDIQKIIYNDYLEKQREYHINNYSNPVLPYMEELKKNQNYISDLLFETYMCGYEDDDEELYDKIDEGFCWEYFNNNKYKLRIKYKF